MKTNLGDLIRGCVGRVDELFINWFGKPLVYYDICIPYKSNAIYYETREKIWSHTPVFLRAFYEIPSTNSISAFGIDDPDEMIIDLGYSSSIKSLGYVPRVGGLVMDHLSGKWLIVQRMVEDDTIKGQSRLRLLTQRLQESATPASTTATSNG